MLSRIEAAKIGNFRAQGQRECPWCREFVAVDGVTFVRVTSPTATDLAGVRAIDDRTAVVSTTDARTFMTRDRGTTWVSVARTLPD